MTDQTNVIKYIKTNPSATVPQQATPGAAGYDLYSCSDDIILLPPNEVTVVPTGIAVQLPPNMEMQIRSRSGIAAKGVFVINSPGTVDSDYRGEVKVLLYNTNSFHYGIEPNSRIAQACFQIVPDVKLVAADALDRTDRGTNGFGSTGIK